MTKLAQLATTAENSSTKEELKKSMELMKQQLIALQDKLYACKKNAVLVIVQGMDASGKDGAIKNVFAGVNPSGMRVYSWKKPSEEEAEHDFLWRIHAACPRKGMIHVFNRSQYEDILVPSIFGTFPKETIEKHYDAINHFEKLLIDSGTLVLKFYLHVSEKEQRERMEERKNNPEKQWKYNKDDIYTIEHRIDFLKVYDNIIERCSKHAPWHIIPADKNTFKEHSILKIVLENLNKLHLEYPGLEN